MATYLVTGGCGFIGSHLSRALRDAGHDVRVLDDLSTGKRENLADGADLTVGCVTDPEVVARLVDGVDGVFHLAAIASVQKSVEDWTGTHRVNLTGTIRIMDAARTAKGGEPVPVVYAASAAVYGDPERAPLDEDAPLRPLTAYGADKLGCELHARVAGCVHGVPTYGMRFFNVFGPNQDPSSPYSGVISIFARRMTDGEGITVFGDGRQVRDFVYVGDVVRHLVAAMERADTDAPVLNVCTGVPTTIVDLARIMGKVWDAEVEIDFAEARAGDIRESLGDPARARAALGVAAEVDLEAGLKRLRESER